MRVLIAARCDLKQRRFYRKNSRIFSSRDRVFHTSTISDRKTIVDFLKTSVFRRPHVLADPVNFVDPSGLKMKYNGPGDMGLVLEVCDVNPAACAMWKEEFKNNPGSMLNPPKNDGPAINKFPAPIKDQPKLPDPKYPIPKCA